MMRVSPRRRAFGTTAHNDKDRPHPHFSTKSTDNGVKKSSKVAVLVGSRVFLWIPNLIGYARVLLMLTSFYMMPAIDPRPFFILYSTSCLLDAVDGHVARFLNQVSMFGAVLDMVTDRVTTAGLVTYLAQCYPQYYLSFQILNGLDLASHYMQMVSSLKQGKSSHKIIDEASVSWLDKVLSVYYNSKLVLFVLCAGNELFYLGLYWLHSTKHVHDTTTPIPLGCWAFGIGVTLLWGLKQFMNLVQLLRASLLLVYSERR